MKRNKYATNEGIFNKNYNYFVRQMRDKHGGFLKNNFLLVLLSPKCQEPVGLVEIPGYESGGIIDLVITRTFLFSARLYSTLSILATLSLPPLLSFVAFPHLPERIFFQACFSRRAKYWR